VHRELVRSTGVPTGTPEPPNAVSTLGRDGKSYPRDLRAAPGCPTCGEVHPERANDCPWDLFAQGLGPHPAGAAARPATGRGQREIAIPGDPPASKTRRPIIKPVKHRETGGLGVPHGRNEGGGGEAVVDDLLRRLEGLVQGVSDFAGLITVFEALSKGEASSMDDLAAVAARIRGLTGGVREAIAAWPSLVDRLEQLANALHSHCLSELGEVVCQPDVAQ